MFGGCRQPRPHATAFSSASAGAPSPALPLHQFGLLLFLLVVERLGFTRDLGCHVIFEYCGYRALSCLKVVGSQAFMLHLAQVHHQVPHLELYHYMRLFCSCCLRLWRDWSHTRILATAARAFVAWRLWTAKLVDQVHPQVPHLKLYHCISLVCSCSLCLWIFWTWRRHCRP